MSNTSSMLMAASLISTACWPVQGADPVIESIEQMSAPVDGHQLQYLLQVPTGQPPADGWPLLLFLHGYGECGDDLDKVKVHGPPKLVEKFAELSSCVIVSPQCPRNSWWRVAALRSLVDEVIANRNDIDVRRRYISGLSMGGFGTWSFLSHYPDYFAAAVPICGGGDPFRLPANVPPKKQGIKNEFDPDGLKRAKDVPIWTYHGSRDGSVPILETERIVALLESAGSKSVHFTRYEDAGHVAAWRQAYSDPHLWSWLFAQRR